MSNKYSLILSVFILVSAMAVVRAVVEVPANSRNLDLTQAFNLAVPNMVGALK